MLRPAVDLTGFDKAFDAPLHDVAAALTTSMREATVETKQAWRNQITAAGLGGRLANTIRSEVYPKGGNALNPAGYLYTKPIGFATGTEYFSGGTALVGEQGRELVDLPAGSKIHNAAATRRMLANDNGGMAFHMPISIDARGADEAGLARVQGQLAQMQREMPDRAVAAVQEWRDRNYMDRRNA